MTSEPWTRYYDATGTAPRDTLVAALDWFESDPKPSTSRLAVDLGCGTGRDTAELLRRGWSVYAVDAESEAIERLRTSIGETERLTTEVVRFEAVRLPPAHLVNASVALPFCPPRAFPSLWERIVQALVPGGRFAGQLFGDRDHWALAGRSPTKNEMTFHTRDEVEELSGPFEVELFEEVEEDGKTALGDSKRWHFFHLVLRKP
jgi:trans-aconitate methyltransferase